MRKQIYRVDSKGYISEIHVGEFDDEGNLVNPIGDFITKDLPQPLYFYKPRWVGAEWVEGATKEEIDEFTKPIPNLPSEFDKIRMEQAKANAEIIEMVFSMMGGGM